MKTIQIEKEKSYYNVFKRRLTDLIPTGPHVILDLGCASGIFGSKLREMNKAKEIVGVEIFPDAAKDALKRYNKVYQGNIEELKLNYRKYFDYVISADIIEHLKDPWGILQRINNWLKPGGYLLISIPNIRYWRILTDLIVHGKWKYREAGILDNTHLRFFTKNSLLEMLIDADFDVRYSRMEINGLKHKLLDNLSLHFLDEFLGTQIIVLAQKR